MVNIHLTDQVSLRENQIHLLLQRNIMEDN